MNERAIGSGLSRVAELCELMAKEMRALAVAVDESRLERMAIESEPERQQQIERGRPADDGRSDDVLWRLEDMGYIREGTVIRLLAKKLPSGSGTNDPRFHAIIGRNPSRPIWAHTGEAFPSLTALTKKLRDELGARIPRSNFRVTIHWCIDGERPERTLASIAEQLVP